MKPAIIDEKAVYTFADYFKLNYFLEEVVGYFGYTVQAEDCVLPQTTLDLDEASINRLKAQLKEAIPYLSLTSEMARREFLIAPILLAVVHAIHAKIKTEYPLEVSAQLKGMLDYLIQGKSNLLIVEAKNEDLQRGFTQLAVELIAFDQWTESQSDTLYGAVSTGLAWQFGILHRPSKRIVQDFNLYTVPAGTSELLKIIVAILNGA